MCDDGINIHGVQAFKLKNNPSLLSEGFALMLQEDKE